MFEDWRAERANQVFFLKNHSCRRLFRKLKKQICVSRNCARKNSEKKSAPDRGSFFYQNFQLFMVSITEFFASPGKFFKFSIAVKTSRTISKTCQIIHASARNIKICSQFRRTQRKNPSHHGGSTFRLIFCVISKT